MDAQCACGQLRLDLPDAPLMVVACHCRACQLRTGAPLGAGAYYPAAGVAVRGERQVYTRRADSGLAVTSEFCPICGSSVFWRAEKLPMLIGVAVGAVNGPLPEPSRSVWETHRRPWVAVAADCAHFPEGPDQPR